MSPSSDCILHTASPSSAHVKSISGISLRHIAGTHTRNHGKNRTFGRKTIPVGLFHVRNPFNLTITYTQTLPGIRRHKNSHTSPHIPIFPQDNVKWRQCRRRRWRLPACTSTAHQPHAATTMTLPAFRNSMVRRVVFVRGSIRLVCCREKQRRRYVRECCDTKPNSRTHAHTQTFTTVGATTFPYK